MWKICKRKSKEARKTKITYGREVDVWAAGVTLYAMCHGYLPFQGDMEDRTLNSMQKQEIPEPPEWNELDHQIVFGEALCKERYVSKSCSALIQNMLAKAKEKRLTAAQVLNHPWLRETDLNIAEFKIFTREEIKYIKEEFNHQREKLNMGADADGDLIKQLLDAQNKGDKKDDKDQRGQSSMRKPTNLKSPKKLKIADAHLERIKREYEEDYHALDEKLRRLDIKDFGRNLFELQSEHDFQQHTSKSSVLGPNNSTRSNKEDPEAEEELRKDIKENAIYPYFAYALSPMNYAKVEKENKRFEELNNEDYDDGVYLGAEPSQSSGARQDDPSRKDTRPELDPANIPTTLAHDFSRSPPRDQRIIDQLKAFGFKPDYIERSLREKRANYCCATYHLLAKDQDKIVGED